MKSKRQNTLQNDFITLNEVAFRLSSRVVFPGTDWTIREGEQWGLLGGNGSGKSVLSMGLMGALPAIHGELIYHFDAANGESPEEGIACVSFERQRELAGDGVAAARWCSIEQEACAAVRDLLSFEQVEEVNPFEVQDRSAARRAFERRKGCVMRQLGIRPLLDRQLVQLSNGEMRKILIARALLKAPRLLILDDPFSGLDAAYRESFRGLMNGLVSHDGLQLLVTATRKEDLPDCITHLAVVKNCRLVEQGERMQMMRQASVRDCLDAKRAKKTAARSKKKSSPTGKVIVRMEHAHLAYDRRVLLRDLTWTVCEGESWAVLGPNGAGKSALLSLIAGNSPQVFANEIYLFGRRRGTGETREWVRRRIGEVSPELHLHFNDMLSVLETVLTGFTDSLVLTGRPSGKRIAQAGLFLRRFGLQDEADTSLRALSAGHQRLALLARALVKEPALLLLDEPCQGLDVRNRTLFMRALQSLVDGGKTTLLLTTHRKDEIPPGIRGVLHLTSGGNAKIDPE
ncbi:MAG: ATP-binding cassette domain-containing protein [Kiritimatiellae bacterium]|nr:ATP-binding cassette domain-containing protein [Kiritimatiellia bacterium]